MFSVAKKVLKGFIAFPLKKIGLIDVDDSGSFYVSHPIILGNPKRIRIGKNVHLNNVTLNTNSGWIIIEDYATIQPNSMLITGTHDFSKTGLERRMVYPSSGRDIVIKKGAWIGPGAIVLGNVTIGENSVIGAGSVVTKNVEANSVAVGNPARVIKRISVRIS